MSLDFYEINNDSDDITNNSNPYKNLRPKVKAVRQDVIDTAIRNKIEGASTRNEHIQKALDYADKFNVFGINDWLEEGRKVFGLEEIKEWANGLSYPLDDIYYLN